MFVDQMKKNEPKFFFYRNIIQNINENILLFEKLRFKIACIRITSPQY